MKYIFLLTSIVFVLYSAEDNNRHIEIKNAYIRMMPPVAKMSASFMEIKNTSSEDIFLIKAKSNISSFTEIHKSSKQGHMMSMKKIDKLKIPAFGTTMLQKGGNHIMFIGLKKPLVKNKIMDLKLNFSNGLIKDLKIPVK